MATANRLGTSILSDRQAAKRAEVIELLTRAYWMEMETVMSYLANSEHLDGVRAAEIAEALAEDVSEELGHARAFAGRIKELYGTPPAPWTSRPSRPISSRSTTRRTSRP